MASGERVAAGPFRGARFTWPCYQDAPCTLGTYEMELAPAIERLIGRGFDRVIDIGAAAGVYVVGLGHRLPEAEFIAYEAQDDVRATLARNVKANGMEARVSLRGYCRPGDLAADLDGRRTLVVVDVEGFEVELLDLRAAPGLASATILVETHDFCAPGCTPLLRGRFEGTHEVTAVTSRRRTLGDFPYRWMTRLGSKLRAAAMRQMCEYRPGTQEWLVMEPRDR